MNDFMPANQLAAQIAALPAPMLAALLLATHGRTDLGTLGPSVGWVSVMTALRAIKPRTAKQLFGDAGPTPEQDISHKVARRVWGGLYRRAAAMQKWALACEEAAAGSVVAS